MALTTALVWQSVSMGVAPKAYTENALSNAVPLPSAEWAKGNSDGDSGVETRRAPQPGEQSLRAARSLKLETTVTSAPQEPSHLDLYFPVYVAPVASVPIVQAASVGTTLSPDDLRAVLRLVGAPEAWIEPLTSIALCESHGRTGAISDGGNSLGPWQMWRGWAAPMGYQPDDLHDPIKAAETAVYVRTVRGRFGGGGGWTCADLLNIP